MIWVCILCRKKQELLIKSGSWMQNAGESDPVLRRIEQDTLRSSNPPKQEPPQPGTATFSSFFSKALSLAATPTSNPAANIFSGVTTARGREGGWRPPMQRGSSLDRPTGGGESGGMFSSRRPETLMLPRQRSLEAAESSSFGRRLSAAVMSPFVQRPKQQQQLQQQQPAPPPQSHRRLQRRGLSFETM